MSIPRKAKITFSTLCEAAREHRLCLTQCEDRKTGKKVHVLCETWTEDGVVRMNPLARFFNGSPFNEVTPPGVSAPKLI